MGAESQMYNGEWDQMALHLIQEKTKEQRFQFIEEHCEEFSVAKMCQLLNVSRSGYYKWLLVKADENSYQKRRTFLTDRVISLFHEHHCRYGSPKITEFLRQDGWEVSERFVGRLMQENGLHSKR